MFITSLKWKFDSDTIRGTPKTQGVFGLWDEGEIVYIGATERNVYLPDVLRELLTLKRRGIIQATHFTWEITITPRSWAGELLRLHFNQHGRLPLYNQPTSTLQRLLREESAAPHLTHPSPKSWLKSRWLQLARRSAVLLGADLPARGRVHPGVRAPVGLAVSRARARGRARGSGNALTRFLHRKYVFGVAVTAGFLGGAVPRRVIR